MLSDGEGEEAFCEKVEAGLNAPFGARCFLTEDSQISTPGGSSVLMHLLALGAFWLSPADIVSPP